MAVFRCPCGSCSLEPVGTTDTYRCTECGKMFSVKFITQSLQTTHFDTQSLQTMETKHSSDDRPSFLLGLLCCLAPLLGVILFSQMQRLRPKAARCYLTCSIVNIGTLSVVVALLILHYIYGLTLPFDL